MAADGSHARPWASSHMPIILVEVVRVKHIKLLVSATLIVLLGASDMPKLSLPIKLELKSILSQSYWPNFDHISDPLLLHVEDS